VKYKVTIMYILHPRYDALNSHHVRYLRRR